MKARSVLLNLSPVYLKALKIINFVYVYRQLSVVHCYRMLEEGKIQEAEAEKHAVEQV